MIIPKWVLCFIPRHKLEPTYLRNEGFKWGFDERKMRLQLDTENKDRSYLGETYLMFQRMNDKVMKIISVSINLSNNENLAVLKSPKEATCILSPAKPSK